MFTGLIEEQGIVRRIRQSRGAVLWEITADKVLQGCRIDDSIAVNGVCLTVVEIGNTSFSVEIVQASLACTTLGGIRENGRVNLERALAAGGRIGGHFVQGHIDGVGKVKAWTTQKGGKLLTIIIPDPLKKYVIHKGSVAIDGVSLTIAQVKNDQIDIALIPHTLEKTTLGKLKPGSQINIETDILGKYIHSFVNKADREPNDIFQQLNYRFED